MVFNHDGDRGAFHSGGLYVKGNVPKYVLRSDVMYECLSTPPKLSYLSPPYDFTSYSYPTWKIELMISEYLDYEYEGNEEVMQHWREIIHRRDGIKLIAMLIKLGHGFYSICEVLRISVCSKYWKL